MQVSPEDPYTTVERAKKDANFETTVVRTIGERLQTQQRELVVALCEHIILHWLKMAMEEERKRAKRGGS